MITNFSQIQFIQAGAGAGKTTRLISTCIDFVEKFYDQHKIYPKLVLTTFTKKAAQEIKERLLQYCLTHQKLNLFEYFNKSNYVYIGTIHGFLFQFMSEKGHVIGLPFSLKFISNEIHDKKLKKIVKKLISENESYYLFLENFSFNQLIEVTDFFLKYVLMNQKVNFVISNDALKFRQNKVQEKVKDLEQFLSLKSFFTKSMDTSVNFLNLILEALKNQDYTAVVDSYQFKPRKFTKSLKVTEIAESLQDSIREIFEEDFFSPYDFNKYKDPLDQINNLFARYISEVTNEFFKKIKETGEITFSDLEVLTIRILNDSPLAMKEFSEKYNFILVDEYQDTSPLQVKILDELCQNKYQFIVGDPQQSIYLFRGARSEVFHNKKQEIENLGYIPESKIVNYRSNPPLMNFINYFFKKHFTQFNEMIPHSKSFQKVIDDEVFFIESEQSEYDAIVMQIFNFIEKEISLNHIAVLFKSNADISEFAKKCTKYKIPFSIFSSQGYENRPEIIDLVCFSKFLINPFDEENLIQLLRSPWFKTKDQELVDYVNLKLINLWTYLNAEKSTEYDVILLNELIQIYMSKGALIALESFISKTDFLSLTQYLDASTQREANIWKFLKEISIQSKENDFSFAQFIYDSFETAYKNKVSDIVESIPLVNFESIKLMTVHASKGLQFEHVIIHGFQKTIKSESEGLYCFDETNYEATLSIYIDELNRTKLPEWTANVRKNFFEKIIQENQRLLYVAMTRAIQTLTFVKRKSDRKFAQSWSDYFDWNDEEFDLQNFKIKRVTLRSEIIEIWKPLNRSAEMITHVQNFAPLKIDETHTNETILIQPSMTSSHTLAEENIPPLIESFSFQGVEKNNDLYVSEITHIEKSIKGVELHRYFESLKYINYDFLDLEDDIKNAISWLYFQNEIPFEKIIKWGYTEWGFSLKHNNIMVTGQIDLWAKVENVIYIIDYKTGSQKYLEKAFKQLEFYASCLKQMNKIISSDQVTLTVIYPLDNSIKLKTKQFFEIKPIESLS